MTRVVRLAIIAACVVCGATVSAQETLKIGTRVGVPDSGYQGFGRRDPFAPLVAPPSATTTATTPARRAPGLAGMAAADVVLKGIISSGSTRLALLEGSDGKTYLARAQDKLQDAIVRRIDADAVVLLTNTAPKGGGRELRKPLRPTADGGGQ